MTLKTLPIVDLAHRCREETLHFLRAEPRDDRFCFALFERAIAEREHDAWEAIMGQYRGIVLAYVGQHAAASMVRESDEYWVNRAFQRFWMAVTPERFERFPDLAALLKYLKMCVHSVLLDEVRARRAWSISSLDEVPETLPEGRDSEGAVIGKLAGQQLWQAVNRELQNEAERVVAYLSFARDLKPAEIFERHPSLYSGVPDVYRVKRNVIERLRRSPEIRAFVA